MTAVAALDAAIGSAGGAESVVRKALKLDAKADRREWPAIDPLPEPAQDEPAPFPFDALGPISGLAASAISRDVQAPDALASGSVLAAAALAVMPHADVLLPHGQRSPTSLFIVTGAGSGDRKSAVDQVALHPVEEARREQARKFLREQAAAGDDKDAPKPKGRSLTIGKATTEGLQQILKGQPGIGLFTAEGAELLGGHSMREERRSAGLAWLLKAWSGETLDALTRGDGLSILLGRRVALHALVQPIVLRALLSDPLAQGQGLLARCLIAQPDSLAGTRLFRDCDPLASEPVRHFHDRLTELLRRPAPLRLDGDGCELQPRLVRMGPAARALWVEFHDAVERQQAPGQPLEHARAFASKLPEHAARIAAVVELVSDPDAENIGDATMDGAMRVADYYLGEHVRLTGAGAIERRITRLRTLVDWMRGRGRAVAHRDVLQRSPNPVRTLRAEGIAPLLAELAERNYIRKAGDVWEVHPNA